jgi:hypothetical protein
MSDLGRRREDRRMKPGDDLSGRAFELLEDARRFQSAAAEPEGLGAVPDTLVYLEDALQVLSAGWYQVAARAAPGLSGEQELRLMGALHEVAAGFARCARVCREGRSAVLDDRRQGNDFPRFQRYDRPGKRVA